jgi:uncharacterized protein YyaL (SSP411 family)
MNEQTSGGDRAARTPETIRREGNRLGAESSLYLRQHAHNPVDWYPWGEEALARARELDRPLFLSIGYASCHWCHVMEREVFEDDEVAARLNEHFVSVKVDREERPDLDAAYMDAVHAITGRGGWPLSVFLTPDGKPFFGGTYFPRDAFLEILGRIERLHREQRGELEEQAGKLAEHVASLPGAVGQGGDVDLGAGVFETAVRQAEINFDGKHGGFKSDQKFPTPGRWQLLLHVYRKTGESRLAAMLGRTLDAMAAGGIYDHVGGGFHRYAVDERWLVPHFEKMLYDNAQLASLYLEAGVVLGRLEYLVVAKDVLDFLLREMRGEEGAFYASFDADSGGEEGSFYVWSVDDLAMATTPDEGPVLAALMGVDSYGNFGNRTSVMTRWQDVAKVAAECERDPAEVEQIFQKWRQALRDHRARRPAPALDRKIVAAWNGLAITAMTQGYAALGDDRYLAAAREAADYIWRVHHEGDGRLRRASDAGEARHAAVLGDYALVADAFLDLFQATGEPEWLSRALSLIERARSDFRHEAGGFYLSSRDVEAPIGRHVAFFDSVMPSGNAALLHVLLKAAALTGREEYRADVVSALRAYRLLLEQAPLELSWWLDAALRLAGPFREVVVAGDPDSPAAAELARVVLRCLAPHAVLARVPAAGPGPELAGLIPPAAGKTAGEGGALAHVCERGACQRPTADPEELRRQLLDGWVE